MQRTDSAETDTLLNTVCRPPTSPMPKIMVVDDDERVRRLLHDWLAEEHDDVALCANGQDALDPIEHGWIPTVVFVDVLMPVTDGTTCLARLKGNALTTSIPVVAISAGLTLKRQMAELVRADALLPKPFDMDQLSVVAAHRVRKGVA